ncbi:hypothetical protein RSOLAG1IB_06754 [Rhizoctonia solani AG-1 IB]|uniref:Protein kinase domain-containing protein n=1 Tax=Thanatephorus cucumeris (strain AG1-IB / isolate 7/3/14) TaxID=1108050 RepID=A0A0B7F928_THACB|nr:hypothetical protein RSOLAG1IB_06754 [Rhizoctonia solani AG-1 IB]
MKRRSFIMTSSLQMASLKLIDFGIAKAIANDTTNIRREHQVGTLNCMSPESIKETQTANGRRLKVYLNYSKFSPPLSCRLAAIGSNNAFTPFCSSTFSDI